MAYSVRKLGRYILGTSKKIRVKIKNTGNSRHTFYVGAAIAKSISGTGCDISLSGTGGEDWFEFYPYRSVTLDPGEESGWLEFNFKTDYLTAGTWYAVAKVWKGKGTGSYTSYFIDSDTGSYLGQKTVEPLTDCLAGSYTTFSVAAKVSAEIVSIKVE